MKLSELVEHTGKWLGMSATSVGSYARFLREARLLSVGTTGAGAADMTDEDKISLLVAVLGCSSARSSPKDLPTLLALKPHKSQKMSGDETLTNIHDPAFFDRADLQSGLRGMFADIANGNIEKWRTQVETGLAKMEVSPPVNVGLTVTFEIDADHVTIRLRASGAIGQKKKLTVAVGPDLEYGVSPSPGIAGYSRRTHEISYERLVGWGSCLSA